jgi:hypothetical protein
MTDEEPTLNRYNRLKQSNDQRAMRLKMVGAEPLLLGRMVMERLELLIEAWLGTELEDEDGSTSDRFEFEFVSESRRADILNEIEPEVQKMLMAAAQQQGPPGEKRTSGGLIVP